MRSSQEAKLKMYRAVIAYCDQSTAITASLPAFATALAAFKATVETIISTAQRRATITTGITINKAGKRKILCFAAEEIAAALFAYATAEKDFVLQQKANYSFTDLFRLKDDVLGLVAQNLHNDALTILASLSAYGITAATLNDFQDLIAQYKSTVAAPRNAISRRKAYVVQLKTLFKASDNFLKQRLDKLAVHFKQSQPQFYTTYKNNRKIVNAPTSATQVKGLIIDSASGLPIYEVATIVQDQQYNSSSNPEGGYSLKIPAPGIYTLNFIKEGYQPYQAPNIEIVLGQATVINVQLIPAA